MKEKARDRCSIGKQIEKNKNGRREEEEEEVIGRVECWKTNQHSRSKQLIF